MRVINQDGIIDIPYERYCFSLKYTDKTLVIAWDMLSSGDEIVEMGKYSSEEKAVKALEMLREKYLLTMELDGGYNIAIGYYVQPNYWVLPKVFQFPKDEEVIINLGANAR